MPRSKARKGISVRTRFEVFKRDNFMCRYCGRRPPDVELVLDHLTAVSKGGTDAVENLVTSCDHCNSGKSDRPVTESALPAVSPEALAQLQASVEQQRIYVELQRERERIIDEQRIEFMYSWSKLFGGREEERNGRTYLLCDVTFPLDEAIRNLLREGLTLGQLRQALSATHRRWCASGLDDAARFFFGCMRRIREEDEGEALITPPAPPQAPRLSMLRSNRETLAGMLLDSDIAQRAVREVYYEDFPPGPERAVFRAMKACVHDSGVVNIVDVLDGVTQDCAPGEFPAEGWKRYLSELLSGRAA